MPPNKSQMLSATVLAIFRANGRLLAWGDVFVAPFDLTSARWQMLGALALAEQTLTAPQIADRMGVTRQGAQKQLNLLLDDQMVEKLPNPVHRRSPLYSLTPRGEALFREVNAAWEAHGRASAQNFSAAELATTLRVLLAIADLHSGPALGETDEA